MTKGAESYFGRLGSPIFGIATSPGSLVSIFRVSGQGLGFLADLLGPLPIAGHFSLRKIRVDSQVVDEAIVLSFEGPRSFTGEDVVELHCHGVPAVLLAVEKWLRLSGALSALPGEFMFRAFKNGRMSLSEIERLNLAFRSESPKLDVSSRLMGFDEGLCDPAPFLRRAMASLARARGRIEAAIDFPEAEAEQAEDVQDALALIEESLVSMNKLVELHDLFAKSLQLPRVVILGRSNVGKSSLLNFLVGGQRALVADEQGTTRDYIEVPVRFPSGQMIRLVDTAGIREGSVAQGSERMGMDRALELARSADVVIFVERSGVSSWPQWRRELPEDTVLELRSFGDVSPGAGAFDLRGANNASLWEFLDSGIRSRLILNQRSSDPAPIVTARQKKCLVKALVDVERARSLIVDEGLLELVGDLLVSADRELRRSVGEDLDESYIDEMFGSFCLGK